jgi:hypothetical protein
MNDYGLEGRREHTVYFKERRKYSRYFVELPLEYWQVDGACRGGLVGNLSDTGLLLHSLQDLPVGKELNIRIFFSNGYEFDGIVAVARIVWKDLHDEPDWKGYKYGIEFVQVSEEDREKLTNVLKDSSAFEEGSTGEDRVPMNHSQEDSNSSPSPSLDSYQSKEKERNCLWDRFKAKMSHFR